MGALPKRKQSKAHRGRRRSHDALKPPAMAVCSQCNSPKLPHRSCPTCGTYDGREVIEPKAPKKKGE